MPRMPRRACRRPVPRSMGPKTWANPDSLRAQIEMVLTHADGALQMSSAALSVAKPDAAEELARWWKPWQTEGKKDERSSELPTDVGRSFS